MPAVLSVAQFRENVPAWSCFHSREDVFPAFFQRVLTLKVSGQTGMPSVEDGMRQEPEGLGGHLGVPRIFAT